MLYYTVMETSNIHVETISEPEPEPLSTEDKLWRNHTEYQMTAHMIYEKKKRDEIYRKWLEEEPEKQEKEYGQGGYEGKGWS